MSARGRDGGGEVPETTAGEDLVSLLYGEMEADEAARTRARIAGDPTEAARLDEMRRVRDLFSSLEDEEPPSRLTAQLMAEAARAAPQQRRAAAAGQPEAGFWARFVSWLQPIVQRPALAAAASLVLVAGVAGVLYMKKGEELTSTAPTAERAEPPAGRTALDGTTGAAAEAPAATPPVTAAEEPAAMADGEDQLADDADDEAAKSEAASTRSTTSKPMAKRRKAAESAPSGKGAFDKAPVKPGVKSGTVYGLSEQEMVPRDQSQAGAEGGGAVGGAASGAQNKSDDAPATQAPEPAPATPPAADKKAPARPSVQELHRRAVDAALDKRCAEVKVLAGQVRSSDAGYYSRTFAGDKRLQSCLASPSRSPAKK